MSVTDSPSWPRLAEAARSARTEGLRSLFSHDDSRSTGLLFSTGDDLDAIALDLSLQFLRPGDLDLLDRVIDESGLATVRSLLKTGHGLNPTEARDVTHVRERSGSGPGKMLEYAGAVRSGAAQTLDGERFTTVVNIGIGGSDLGPRLVAGALGDADGIAVRFVANVDPRGLDEALAGADRRRTLVVISSKTMSTAETLHNASRARQWLESGLGADALRHVAAVTADPGAAAAWGVSAETTFSYDAGIGGRFSLSSSAGLAAAVACGPERFVALLEGMREMDRHFLDAPTRVNLPVLHGMTAFLNAEVHGCRSTAVVPYADRLALLVPYLQQLTMESNGKSVDRGGRPLGSTAPALWGSVGTEGQHAYFQWLHQGTDPTPVEVVVVADLSGDDTEMTDGRTVVGDPESRRGAAAILVANALAQTEVLAFGRTAEEVRATGCPEDLVPHRVFSGNRPSSKILMRRLSPRSLGSLLAFYEHSTAVQGWLWGVNSFDQFGVELGKELAAEIGSRGASDRPIGTGGAGGPSSWTSARRWLEG